MAMPTRLQLFLVIQLLFVAVYVAPVILHALEYERSTPVTQTTVTAAPNPPSQVSFTVDSNGHKHWVATVYDSVITTVSVAWVKHVYIFGVAADWLDSANTAKDINEMYYAALLFNIATFFLLLGPEMMRVMPHFLNKPN